MGNRNIIFEKYLPIFTLLLAILPFNLLAIDEETWTNNVMEQFQQYMDYNAQVLKAGQRDRIEYIFEYNESGEWLPLNNCNTQWVKEDPCDPTISVIPNKETLNGQINNFNNNNQQGINLFAFYIAPPNTLVKSSIPSYILSNNATVQDVTQYLRGKSLDNEAKKIEDQVKVLRQKLSDQLDTGPLGNATEKVLIFSSGFDYANSENPEYMTISDVWVRGTFVGQTSNNLKKAIDEDRFFSKDKTENISGRRIENAVLTSLAFFEDPLQIDLTLSCSQLKTLVSNQAAKDFLDGWCAHVNSLNNGSAHKDEIKKYVIATAQYIDKLDPPYNYDPSHPDHSIRFGWADGALSYYTAAVQSAVLWREFLAKCIDRADASSNNHRELGVWFRHATDEDYRKLSVDRRFKLIKLQYENRNNSQWDLWEIWDDQYVKLYSVKKILRPITEEHTAAEVQQLLNQLQGESGLVEWLFEIADGLYASQSKEEELINILIEATIHAKQLDLIQLTNNFASAFDDKAFIWKPSPWYYSVKDIEYEQSIDANGHVQITQTLLEECDYPTYDPHSVPVCTYDVQQVPGVGDPPLKAFDLVALTMEGRMNFLSDCGANNGQGCQNKTLLMPAFAFAWIIEKKSDDDAYQATVTTLEVVSLLIGGGELLAAVKAGNKAKMLLAGWSFASDVLDLTVSDNINLQNYLQSTYNTPTSNLGTDLYNALQIFNLLNSSANGLVSAIDIIKATEGVAAFKYLEEKGYDFSDLQDPEKLIKRAKDMQNMLENTGHSAKIAEEIAKLLKKAPFDQIETALQISQDLAKRLADIPGSSKLLSSVIQAKLNSPGFSANKIEFLEDLTKNAAKFGNNNAEDIDMIRGLVPAMDEKLIDAWSLVRRTPDTEIKRDSRILIAARSLLVNNPGISQVYEQRVRKALGKLSGAGAICTSCKKTLMKDGEELVYPHMRSLEYHINNLDVVTQKHYSTPGFLNSNNSGASNTFLVELGASPEKAIGGAWILEVLATPSKKRKALFNKGAQQMEELVAFEFSHISGQSSRIDLVTRVPGSNVNIYTEFKNWSGGGRLNADWAKQLTETLGVASDWRHLKQIFNTSFGRWSPSTSHVTNALKKYHDSFTSNTSPLTTLASSLSGNNYLFPGETITDANSLIEVLVKAPYFDEIFKAIN